MSFENIYTSVGSLIHASGLELYPEGYSGKITTENLHGRYTILLPDHERISYQGDSEINGMVIVRIFHERGKGGKEPAIFADTLRSTFDLYTGTGISFGNSNLSNSQDDPDNDALAMMIWQVPLTQHL